MIGTIVVGITIEKNGFMDNYQLLIQKLDEFIRKYYKNHLLKGVIYTLAFFLVAFLIFSAIEYFGHFNTTIRTILFYTFVFVNALIFAVWIVLPFLQLMRLGKVISHDQAAQIIGTHFPNVRDKLLNTLQLKRMAEAQTSSSQKQIIEASINQRIGKLKPVPFTNAINLGENKKYLKYALVPLVVLIIISFSSPHIVFNSTERLIKHRTYYEEKAPFQFNLLNDTLKAVRQENYKVNLAINGEELPRDVYIHVNDNRFRMNKKGPAKHQYTLRNLQDNFQLRFEANDFYSKPYQVKVLPQPLLQEYSIKLDYPEYTGKKDQTKQNVGDLNIPAGTKVSWQFKTQNTEKIKMVFGDTTLFPNRDSENQFSVKKSFFKNQRYYLKPINEYMGSQDSSLHYVSVVPDAYPQIKVKKQSDSLSEKRKFFSGEASDDYGISNLAFHYQYVESKDSAKLNQDKQTEYLDVKAGQSLTNFYHSWDMNKLNIQPGDEINYYFVVWDNDGVNGSKSTKSQTFTFKAPTEEELKKEMDQSREEIEKKLKETAKSSQELEEQIKKAKEKMLDKDQLSWEDKQYIKKLIERQKSLQKRKEKLNQQYRNSLRKQNEYNQLDQSMKEKHERMNEIMKNNTSKNMKEKLEELEKMLNQNQKESIEEKLDKLSKENKSSQKQLERSLELYKKLALEEKMKSTSKELEKLAKEQDELSKETKKSPEEEKGKKSEQSSEKEKSETGDKQKQSNQEQDKGNKDSDKGKNSNNTGDKEEKGSQKGKKKDQESADDQKPVEKQKSINKDFESIQKDLEDIKKLNQQLDNPSDLKKQKKQSEEIQKLLKESLKKLKKQQNQDASQKQKNASDKMKKMSKQMQSKMSKMNQKSMMLNYQRVRKILENLIHFSKEQEALMKDFEQVKGYNPTYVDLAKKQSNLKEDAEMIEDSLKALSEKVMMVQSKVNKEIEEINYQMKKTREYLSNRKIGKVRKSQQYIMTSSNNLAVLLSELMNQMQQQMSTSMSGSQMCQSPKPGKKGKSGGKMGKLKKMQEKLGKKMGDLKKGKQGDRQGASSKDLARLAKLQEKIRQKLKELRKQKENPEGELNEKLKKMEKLMKENEKEIINNNISGQTMKRQQQIQVKMLEAKDAERKQGKDNKRESKTAEELFRENPPSLEEYQEERKRQIELLQTVPPTLNGYYRMKVQEYFKSIQ